MLLNAYKLYQKQKKTKIPFHEFWLAVIGELQPEASSKEKIQPGPAVQGNHYIRTSTEIEKQDCTLKRNAANALKMVSLRIHYTIARPALIFLVCMLPVFWPLHTQM